MLGNGWFNLFNDKHKNKDNEYIKLDNLDNNTKPVIEPSTSHIDLNNNAITKLEYISGLNVDFPLEPGRFCCFNVNGKYKTVYVDKDFKHIHYSATITEDEKLLIKPFIKEYLKTNNI